MIKFIDLTGQIENEENLVFAFFNTITDTFEEFQDSQIWCSIEEFKNDTMFLSNQQRYLKLIPDKYKKTFYGS